jgi:hypothetical protein
MVSRNNDIANELQEIIPGAEWPGLTPNMGDVPAGYFEQLPAQIMQKIRTEEIRDELTNISPLLADVPKTFPFSAPDGYFEQLSTQIMQKIAVQEELESISPLLAEVPKEFPLSVPAGYFDQLTANILAEVKTPAKVVPMRTYLKWAVAAGLIALISVGTLFFMQRQQSANTPVSNDNSLADVSDQAIVDYLQTHMDTFDKEELLSFASLNIETTPVPLPETSEMSAEAIQNFLDNTSLLKESSTEN